MNFYRKAKKKKTSNKILHNEVLKYVYNIWGKVFNLKKSQVEISQWQENEA